MPENFSFEAEATDLLERAVSAFAEWMAKNWSMTAAEAETLTEPTDAPAAYARGYNDAVAAMKDAAENWIEEGAPYV